MFQATILQAYPGLPTGAFAFQTTAMQQLELDAIALRRVRVRQCTKQRPDAMFLIQLYSLSKPA